MTPMTPRRPSQGQCGAAAASAPRSRAEGSDVQSQHGPSLSVLAIGEGSLRSRATGVETTDAPLPFAVSNSGVEVFRPATTSTAAVSTIVTTASSPRHMQSSNTVSRSASPHKGAARMFSAPGWSPLMSPWRSQTPTTWRQPSPKGRGRAERIAHVVRPSRRDGRGSLSPSRVRSCSSPRARSEWSGQLLTSTPSQSKENCFESSELERPTYRSDRDVYKPSAVGSAQASVEEDMVNTHVSGWCVDPEVCPKLAAGVEVVIGDHVFRCLDVLGSGSYSFVWRAEVVDALNGASLDLPGANGKREVALKDVQCKSEPEFEQSLFEVKLLQAFEQAHSPSFAGPAAPLAGAGARRSDSPERSRPSKPPALRFPRCFGYRVDTCEEGSMVRTVMARLPGEQLDVWLRRTAVAAVEPADQVGKMASARSRSLDWVSEMRRGCVMAERLVQQVGPTLERLASLAWHRDVNSHNLLVSDGLEGTLSPTHGPEELSSRASFWLVDFGLAVDSQKWVSTETREGDWRSTDISGDCRYWPVSSWMMHLFGSEFLQTQRDFCNQYQTRLDIHGLGITAVELICTTALAVRSVSTMPEEDADSHGHWGRLLDTWQLYVETVEAWWVQIYRVFSTGGDFRPVHSWLVQQCVADQVTVFLEDIRSALRTCIGCAEDPGVGRVLHMVAELIDETSTLELRDVCSMRPIPPARSDPEDGTRLGAATVSGIAPEAQSPDTVALAAAVAAGGWHALDADDLAARAAAEGRMALASLPPIPAVAGSEERQEQSAKVAWEQRPRCTRPRSSTPGRKTQVEMQELVQAQTQLRQDLERLQLAKLKLQYARKVQEDQLLATTVVQR